MELVLVDHVSEPKLDSVGHGEISERLEVVCVAFAGFEDCVVRYREAVAGGDVSDADVKLRAVMGHLVDLPTSSEGVLSKIDELAGM